MDPARKRHFLQRWDRRQLYVRDRIREHLHDVAVDARIDWLHHRDLNNRSTLDSTLSPRRVPVGKSNNPIDYLSPHKKPFTVEQQKRYQKPSRVAVTKLMSPFPKSAADVIEDYLKGSLDAVNRSNPDMDYRVMADDATSRWEESVCIPSVTADNTDTITESKDFAPKEGVALDQSLNRIREQFSERTLREIQRTRKRMHDMADKNRGRYLDLTKQYLGLDKEDIDSGDESGDEAFDDDVNKRKEQLYAETIDDAGLSVLYRVDDEQNDPKEEDNKKTSTGVSIGTSYASPDQRKKLRRRK